MKPLPKKVACFLLLFAFSLSANATDAWTTYINTGDLQVQDNKLDDAETSYQEALTDIEPEGGIKLAYTLNRLATIHRLQHKWQEALDESQKALTIWNNVRGAASMESARTMTDMAEAYLNLGLPADTENYLRQALVIVCRPKNTATLGSQFQGRNQYVNNLINDPSTIPGSPDAVRVLTGWVSYYLSGNHFTEAESLQKRSVEMLRQMKNGYNTAIIYSPPEGFIPWGGTPDLPVTLLRLGDMYVLQGRLDLAESPYEEAVKILESTLGPSNGRTLNAKTHTNSALQNP